MGWIDDVLEQQQTTREWLDGVRRLVEWFCGIYEAEGMCAEETAIFVLDWVERQYESGEFDFILSELCKLYLDEWVAAHGE